MRIYVATRGTKYSWKKKPPQLFNDGFNDSLPNSIGRTHINQNYSHNALWRYTKRTRKNDRATYASRAKMRGGLYGIRSGSHIPEPGASELTVDCAVHIPNFRRPSLV
ncbi:hypothetical protein RB195_020736 [Necator americanus]|uniref:Uncharacterized protein n=1 Tax=Necator americanus TaxID=51031 RepID=A0ABR1CMF9_NECAM